MKIILIGFPGSGKSTQAKKLGEYFSVPYLGTGSLVRNALDGSLSEYKDQVSNGFLLPDHIVFKIVSDKINEFDINNGFVMEGYPRTVDQAKLLDCFLMERKTNLDLVMNLTIGEEAINNRVLHRHQCKYCGTIVDCESILSNNTCPSCQKIDAFRTDDTKSSLEKRIELFQAKSFPLLEYYSKKGLLFDIDASGTIDFVFQSILSCIQRNLKKSEMVS